MCKTLKSLLAATLCCAAVHVSLAVSPRLFTGVATIGLEAFTVSDATMLSDALVRAGGNLEVTFLFASFDPAHPWRVPWHLVTNTVPRLNGTLRLVAYLDDGPNRRAKAHHAINYGPYFRPDLSPTAFWALAGGPDKNKQVPQFYRDWTANVAGRYREGALRLVQWAAEHGLADKLELVVVPVLEDDAGGNVKAFSQLLKATQVQLVDLPVAYRRNGAKHIVGLPLESHGLSAAGLRSGDTLTNDGSPATPAVFEALQTRLQTNNIATDWWEGSYNGGPRSTPPDKRGFLTPFSGATSPQAKQDELIDILRAGRKDLIIN